MCQVGRELTTSSVHRVEEPVAALPWLLGETAHLKCVTDLGVDSAQRLGVHNEQARPVSVEEALLESEFQVESKRELNNIAGLFGLRDADAGFAAEFLIELLEHLSEFTLLDSDSHTAQLLL